MTGPWGYKGHPFGYLKPRQYQYVLWIEFDPDRPNYMVRVEIQHGHHDRRESLHHWAFHEKPDVWTVLNGGHRVADPDFHTDEGL